MPPSPEGVVVRHATEEDVPLILQLIQELAAYEKESSSVEATTTSLLSTLSFSPSTPLSSTRPAKALLLFTPSGNAAGLALYFYNYSTWRAKPGIYLEDLYVRDSERGKGYGTKLLGTLAKEVVQMDGGRLEWAVLKWNEPSIRFYESEVVGAKCMDEWQTMRVDGEGLRKLAEKAG